MLVLPANLYISLLMSSDIFHRNKSVRKKSKLNRKGSKIDKVELSSFLLLQQIKCQDSWTSKI